MIPFSRAIYKTPSQLDWRTLKNPVATKKYDGAHYQLEISSDGSMRFYSRRPSVKGGHPERTAAIPHISSVKLPQYAGHVYAVELIHTGHSKSGIDAHNKLSGILNSTVENAIATQKETGPVRAVLLDVRNPEFSTYRQKLLHLKQVEKAVGKPDVFYAIEPKITTKDILDLIQDTKLRGEEGVIITDLDQPEYNNPRVKIKHTPSYNLRISGFTQEIDKNGKPKQSVGAFKVSDASNREVGQVGSGLSRDLREDAFKNPEKYLHQLIQVKTMGFDKDVKTGSPRLRQPVYNGYADGNLDYVTY